MIIPNIYRNNLLPSPYSLVSDISLSCFVYLPHEMPFFFLYPTWYPGSGLHWDPGGTPCSMCKCKHKNL